VSVADGSMEAGGVAEHHWVELWFSINAGVIHKWGQVLGNGFVGYFGLGVVLGVTHCGF